MAPSEASEVLDDPDVTQSTPRPGRRPGRPRKSVAPSEASVVEPSEASVVDTDVTATPKATPLIKQSESTAKKPAPRRPRKSAAPRQEKEPSPDAQSQASAGPAATPKASASPEPKSPDRRTPLDDITNKSVADSQASGDENVTIKPIKAMDAIFEKPMDIVLKSRAQMAVPIPEEDKGPKPRIVITYLILNNFKSYAGRQEVGPFHASFSSVVGPNGSGKSNVIDSLLFVFGFRASKMRQGKLSALIHNSAQYPNLDHCEVAVHFQEVLDQVRVVIYSSDCNELTINSPAVHPRSFRTPKWLFPDALSKTTRANITLTEKSPTSQ